MKKHFKHKGSSVTPQVGPDIANLIHQVQQQITFLEKKIDTLIGNSSPRPVEAKPFHNTFQQSGHTHGHGERRQDNSYRERILHKAICADCRKECEVPFKPSGERPVYCKECFSKRKSGSSFKGRSDNRPRETGHIQAFHSDKLYGGEKKRFGPKKRPAVKRRKVR